MCFRNVGVHFIVFSIEQTEVINQKKKKYIYILFWVAIAF